MPKKYVPKGSRRGKGGKRVEKRGGVSRGGVDYHGASKTACPSGKWRWVDRAGAKTLLKALRNNGDHGSRVYRCFDCDGFHVGHMPKDVRAGKLSTRDIYGPKPEGA